MRTNEPSVTAINVQSVAFFGLSVAVKRIARPVKNKITCAYTENSLKGSERAAQDNEINKNEMLNSFTGRWSLSV